VAQRGVQRWFRLPVRERSRTEEDVLAELTAHLDARVDQLVGQGMSPEAARAEAERRLGGIAHARDRMIREAWERDRQLTLLERALEWRTDLRQAARSVLRERAHALVVIGTLALGIGANATMFGIVDRLLLTGPAHVESPEQLRRFFVSVQADAGGEPRTWAALHYPALLAFREGVPSMTHVSAYIEDRRVMGSGPDSREVVLGAVTPSFFDMTRVRPLLGRYFDDSEDAAPVGEHVIVLSYELWQSAFGGDAGLVGREVELSGAPYTVVGVAPPGFTGVDMKPVEAWTPLSLTLHRRMRDGWQANWMSYMIQVVGRLAPGATPERASAEASASWRRLYETLDVPAERREPLLNARVTARDVRASARGDEPLEARVSRWLMLVSGVVLLVACANVANLHVGRALRRRRETAVRLSLGITRIRLIRLLLMESLVLAVLGGIAALAVAYWGAQFVRSVLLPDVQWTSSPLDVRVLAVSGALTLVVAVVTGLVPAIQSLRISLAPALTGAAHGFAAPGRIRSALVVLQAGFCVLLLVGAGLFIRSLDRIRSVDLGMRPERVLQLQLGWQPQAHMDAEEQLARRDVFFAEALERLPAMPAIELASAAIGSPFHSMYGGHFQLDPTVPNPVLPGGTYTSAVTPGYFETLGTPLLHGRTFVPGDGPEAERVLILGQAASRAIFSDADPIGRCLYSEPGVCTRVVGVVADVRRFRVDEDAAMQFYVPMMQRPDWLRLQVPALLVRTVGPPARAADDVRRALFDLDPALQHVRAAGYLDSLDPQWRPWRLGATLFAFCGLLALAIAAIGLYSVIAYMVLHRRQEIGIRVALGAERHDIVGLVVKQALSLAITGIAIGLGLALVGAPRLQPLLYETSARDGVVLIIVAFTLVNAALAAGIAPALRASRVPPTQALRDS
jgi:predicted permease